MDRNSDEVYFLIMVFKIYFAIRLNGTLMTVR
jgi:hypothetical protein